jgi:two-component system, OmpR family, response regulator
MVEGILKRRAKQLPDFYRRMSRKKILIIDDEEDFCLLLKSFFKNTDVEIYAANTLDAGLKSMETFKPDILFLDNNLPDGLGWDQISIIINQYPSTEINLMSAYENREFGYLRNYPVKFWEKPINFEELNRYVS